MSQTITKIETKDRRMVEDCILKFSDRNKRFPSLAELRKASPFTMTFLRRVVKEMIRNGELYVDGEFSNSSILNINKSVK